MARDTTPGWTQCRRTVETKGLDFVDKERAKREAQKQAEAQLQDNY